MQQPFGPGFLDDADKFDAIAASELLIMPSYFESLSMVALEAWALGRPVLANAKCDVLQGQYYKALIKCRGLFEFEQVRLSYVSPSLSKGAA